MIDLSEELLTLSQAAQRLPNRTATSTVWRWTMSGTRYGKLESIIIGGVRYTSVEALKRFIAQSTAAADGR